MPARPTISSALRAHVEKRAGGRCEYCLRHQDDSAVTHELDHIIALKHGGKTEQADNLALACLFCNRNKGADLTSVDPASGLTEPLFNPRIHIWKDHFELIGARIVGVTPIGRATVRLLRFNDPLRVSERLSLIESGRFEL